VQLYTVRSIIESDPATVLGAIDKIGYREAEVTQGNIMKIWDSLKQTKLKPVSVHLDTPLFIREQEKLPAVLESVKSNGFQYAVCPYIAPADRGGPEVMKRLGETLNKAGEQCKSMGVQLCYHNHAFEFAPAGDGTLLDVLMSVTDRKLVQLEMDMMWVQVAGANPVSVLEKFSGRVPLMHLKDVAKGTEPRFNENIPKAAFMEVGSGMVDVPAVLKAASTAGVKHYFVEQDSTPGNPIDSLRKSFEYLHSLNY
jgi:sugar phosphate isomerase/epimerase